MRETTLRDYEERLLRVRLYIEGHLDEDLPLEVLAREANMSSYHFHRIFSGMLGESVKAYVRRLRLEHAANRLAYSSQPVTRIALEAGYESHEAFSRAFKGVFEASPSQFREEWHGRAPGSVIRAKTRTHTPTGGNIMDVRIENLPTRRVAFARHTGPL